MAIPEWFTEHPGSESWWQQQQQQQGLPRIEDPAGGECLVTFLWRDPQGCEKTSACQHVWINITGITDHHQKTPPRSLQRIAGSDVWFWQTTLPADWRGSYCLIPDSSTDTPDDAADVYQRREWWRQKFTVARHDPLNPLRHWSGGRGMSVSPLHMPDAPPQPEWQSLDQNRQPAAPTDKYLWDSALLGNQRRIHLCQTGSPDDASRPLVLLLDGQFWADQMPVAGPLHSLTTRHRLPPAIYVMIDIIDRQHRTRELTCNPEFWLAIQQELLPLISQWTRWQPAAERTLVAGQSFGGLSAVYAALRWPEVFSAAISLSGSFWWPARGKPDGWLTEQLNRQAFAAAPRRIYLEAGRREHIICQANSVMLGALKQQNIDATLKLFEGGHDALCWRGGLLDGLQAILNPVSEAIKEGT
ncbi:enterochelin esterase [Tatumella sp. JGM130]|uniref:enterochelin esterase n=1 Tax=Tatumella sp. JGM130 TaxID=2799797 RepID=UPI001BB06151|nr:enterochelin esterase [Tatumella sp. JGM130]MBS0893458.1 enterochelin esterase [Tatumella sp. JGM130]